MFNICPNCEEEILASRLQKPPAWRGSFKDEYIAFNRWSIDNAQNTVPPITLLNTSEITVEKSLEGVEQWIHNYLHKK